MTIGKFRSKDSSIASTNNADTCSKQKLLWMHSV